ncbi:MAG TPA: hypothetical protein VGH38_19625, partial [Bryobacteraceae bacterium]
TSRIGEFGPWPCLEGSGWRRRGGIALETQNERCREKAYCRCATQEMGAAKGRYRKAGQGETQDEFGWKGQDHCCH